MTQARALSRPQTVVFRRNLPQLLAGVGYAAITGTWLIAAFGQSGASVGVALLGLMVLTGLALAILRDDLIVGNGQAIEVRGLPGFTKRSTHALASFDRIIVEEDAVESYEEDAVRPVRRAWFSVCLTGAGTSVRVFSIDADESESGRARGRRKTDEQARRLSDRIGFPFSPVPPPRPPGTPRAGPRSSA